MQINRLITALLLLMASGCTGKERACGLDGRCPPNTVCVNKLCKNVPWWADVRAYTDASGGACTGAAGDAADGAAGAEAPAPAEKALLPRAAPAGGWLSGALIIHGGDTAAGGRCAEAGRSTSQSATWAPCTPWRVSAPSGPAAGTPGSRSAAASAVGLGSLWVLGGWQRDATAGLWTPRGDLWRLEGNSGTWSLAASEHIPARHHAAIAVQTSPPSVWLFGGDAGSTPGLGTLMPALRRYRLDKHTWELPPVFSALPKPRAEHGMVAVQGGASLLMFGGRTSAGLVDELWRLDTKAVKWTQLANADVRPTPRRGAAVAATDQYLWVFGGIDASAQRFRNDLWRMPLASPGKWQRMRAGDLGKVGESGGVLRAMQDACIPPSGFTALDKLSPPRRSHALLAGGAGALWLYGGRGPCGGLGDLWQLNPGDGSWRLRVSDQRGWPCARRGESCAQLCAP